MKWKSYSSKNNSWVISDDMNCDELIDEFEKARAEKIVGAYSFDSIINLNENTTQLSFQIGATKANGDVFYMVRMKGLIHPEKVCSNETRNKWPMLVIDFLEKNIVLVADTEQNHDQGIMAGGISLARNTVGEPLALHCKKINQLIVFNELNQTKLTYFNRCYRRYR